MTQSLNFDVKAGYSEQLMASLTLLHSEGPKLYRVLAHLRAVGLVQCTRVTTDQLIIKCKLSFFFLSKVLEENESVKTLAYAEPLLFS